MVDVDRERRRIDDARLGSHPARARAVDRDEHALAEVLGTLPREAPLLELEEAVLARERRGSAEEHDDVLAELLQRKAHAEERSERVAVGRLVRGDDEALLVAEGGRDRLHVSLGRHRALRARARR